MDFIKKLQITVGVLAVINTLLLGGIFARVGHTPTPPEFEYQAVYAPDRTFTLDMLILSSKKCDIVSARRAQEGGQYGSWGYEVIAKCPVEQ